jgi:CRISPR-associated protein Csm3
MGENREIKLVNRIIYHIDIEVLTGLHIGGTKEIYGIGGIDSPVIKNPITNKPIIPGSSIKGKLKSLMNLAGVLNNQNNVIFAGNNEGPTRGIFRDMMLTEKSSMLLEKQLGDFTYTEIKTENKINPLTGTSEGGLRFIERVPAGAVFSGEIIMNIYNEDNADCFRDSLEQGFRLLEHNYLGGSGTRGYGKVKISVASTDVL